MGFQRKIWLVKFVLLVQVGCIIGVVTKLPDDGIKRPPERESTKPQLEYPQPELRVTKPQQDMNMPDGFTRPPHDKVTYSCPKECQGCQYFKDNTKVCMAYDDVGKIRASVYDALSTEAKDHFNFMKNSTLFKTTAYGATCDGLELYLKEWGKLGSSGMDLFITFVEDPRNLTTQELEKLVGITLVPFGILKDKVERKMYNKMKIGQKLVLCKAIRGTDCFTKVAISNRLNCGRILLQSGAARGKDISSLIDQSNCTNWDNEQWNLTMKYSPDVLKMECLKIAPADVIIENIDSLSRLCHKLKKRQINVVAKIAIDKLKNESDQGISLSSDVKDALADFLSACGADPTMMGDLIPKNELLSKVDYSKTDTKSGIKFMKEVLKTVQPKDLNKDQIVNSFKMMVFNRSLLNELNETELEAAVCEICDKADDFDDADLAKLAKVVLDRIPSMKDPSTYDQTTIDCIGPLLKFLPMQSFDRIPADVFKSAYTSGKMKNMTVTTRAMAKKIFEAAKSASGKTFDKFSKLDVENLGPAVVSLDAKDLSKIPDDVFGDDIIELFATNIKKSRNTENKPSKAVVSALMEKVKQSSSGVKKALEGGLGDDIPTDILINASLSELPDITGDTAEVTIEVDNKRAEIFMTKLKDKLGDLDSTDTNFTIQRFRNIEKIACGLTPLDIKNISKDNACVDKMNAITNSPCIRKAQVKAALDSYKKATNFESSTEDEIESSTESSTLSQTTPELMVQFRYEEMKKFGTSNKDVIVSVVAEADKKVMDKNNMRDGFKFVMEAKGKSTTGSITKDDLDQTGNVVCGIDISAISRLDADALDEYASQIEKCPLGAEERKALASNIMGKLDLNVGSKVNATNILTLGTSLGEMTDSQLDAIDEEILCDMSDKVAKAFKDKEDEDTSRKMEGFKMDITERDEAIYIANKKKVMGRLLLSQDACAPSTGSSAGRRRRSISSLTCSYMRNIGPSGLSALTLDQINNLEDTEFTDCVDILGAVNDYSTDQKVALATVGKRIWGTASTWDATTVFSAGVIVQGLLVAEIETLTLDLDAISKMGEFDGWTYAQKKALFDRWLTLEKSRAPGSITSSELRSLGHMTCGATASHILIVPHSVYASAADAVGEVTSCDEEQLASFMVLAKNAYGSDVTKWDFTTVGNIGTVIGGMNRSDIAVLSEAQIDAIDSNHLSYIPVSKFAAFTASQIRTFSVSQAQSTTAEQRNALDQTKLAALSYAADTTFSYFNSGSNGGTNLPNPSSKGYKIQVPWLMTLLVSLVAVRFHCY